MKSFSGTLIATVCAACAMSCSGASAPTPQVPAELICKLNVLMNLPRDPEDIDYLAIESVVRAVRGCTVVHLPDAGP